MSKKDVFKKAQAFDNWKKEAYSSKAYLEKELTKENTKHLLNFVTYLEDRNRGKRTLYENKNKMAVIMRKFQERGFNDLTKVKEDDALKFFSEWQRDGHSTDYAKRFKVFWNYWMKINRRKGIAINDITIDLNTTTNGTSKFVWITKKQLDDICEYLTEDEQVIIRFVFDSIIRSPSELMSLYVEDVSLKGKGVWLNIPDEISKTFGRRFNLVYSGEMVLDYIEKNKLKAKDRLFNFSPVYFNRKLKLVAKRLFKDSKSDGGEYFKNLTLYDLRHSGAIHFRKLFQETGQSLDSLRHRGGWADFKMINYYTKMLAIDGFVNKEKTLLQEDKTELEKKFNSLKEVHDLDTEILKAVNQATAENVNQIKDLQKKLQLFESMILKQGGIKPPAVQKSSF